MKQLIAYFSWSGNTHTIAKQIHKLVGRGNGCSLSHIAKICPGSEVREGFCINGYAVSDSNSEVEEFITHIKLN